MIDFSKTLAPPGFTEAMLHEPDGMWIAADKWEECGRQDLAKLLRWKSQLEVHRGSGRSVARCHTAAIAAMNGNDVVMDVRNVSCGRQNAMYLAEILHAYGFDVSALRSRNNHRLFRLSDRGGQVLIIDQTIQEVRRAVLDRADVIIRDLD